MSRVDLLQKIVAYAGTDVASIVNLGSGWPGILMITLPSGQKIPVAAHVSLVGDYFRKSYEVRFQNPGGRTPVANPNGSLPILLGLYEDNQGATLVALDGRSRLGRESRFSILFNKSLLDEARASGWAIYVSSTNENIYGMHPSMLPLFVELVIQGLDTPMVKPTSDELGKLAVASGLLDHDDAGSRQRARRAAHVLIRDRAFGSGVVDTYGGFCAMCGIDFGFVVGAHIYPASAPNSPDKLWNGLALCHNHHAAFDSHRIWIDPEERSIKVHPDLEEEAANNAALNAFLESTYDELVEPGLKQARPRKEMFVSRYEYFPGRYDWSD